MSSTLKIGIVGDCDVGKSSLIASFINKSSTFITNIKPTMGINYEVVTNNHSKSVHQFSFASTSNHYYTIQLWDVSGHETSSIFAKGLYPHLDALILVFDITNSKSLQSCCSYWLNEVRKLSKSVAKLHKLTMLLGNKIDQHVFDHSVSIEEQSRVADRYDIPFCVRASAKTGVGVSDGFTLLIDALLKEKQHEDDISFGFSCLPSPTKLFMGDHNHRSTDSQLLKLYAASASVRSPHRFVDSQDCQRQDYRKIGTNGSVSSPDGVNGGIINMNMNMNRVLTTSVGTVSRNGSNGSNSLSLSSVASQESDFLLAPHTNIDSTGRSDTVLLHPRHPLSTQVSPTALSGTNTLDKTKTEHNWGPHNDYIRAIPESATAMEYAPHLPLMK